jgi:hypothetical protein
MVPSAGSMPSIASACRLISNASITTSSRWPMPV